MVYVVFTNFPECHCRLDTELLSGLQSCITMFVCDSACVAVLGVILTR